MIKISYPRDVLRVRREEGTGYVFDELRKKWLVLTPEEWVRQNFIQYLTKVMEYPSGLIAVEKEIRLGELRKRFDIVVFTREIQPWMIIECKEMKVELSYKTIDQIVGYQMALPSEHLVITNGSYTYAFKKNDGRFVELTHLPGYPN